MIRRILSFGALLVVAGFLVAPAAHAQERGGTLVMVVQPEPPTLAAYLSTSGPIGQVATKVFDGLLEYNFDLKPQPSLAESWTVSEDGKTITFKLRKDVTFHDGKPLTSADVKFSILEVLKKVHPRGPNTFREVTDIETPDAYTAIFKLANPAQGDIKQHENANKPIGSGPFKFVEWQRGQYMRFDRNPNYWKKGQPYLDRIVARV